MHTSNNGSEWRRWDLHFHTPASYDYKNKATTASEIIAGLEANGISVVAITDHHIMNVKLITELQKLGKERNITVLPGIEFLADARGKDPLHFIGIFSEQSNTDYIWKQIESRTDIKKIQGENKKPNEVYCVLFETIKLIKELGGIVSIHAGDKSNSIENITHSLPHTEAQKIDIARVVDIFEMGKEEDCIEYNNKVIPFLKSKMGKHIPLVICSDNHLISNYVTKQSLWIKADPTFEGLKQIIYEPEDRIKIQKDEPDYKEDKLIIEEVKFISSDSKFTSNPIRLNRNLNVIIGGKSSGKSILLYNIAHTLLANQDFFKKAKIENKYDLRDADKTFNFEICTKGGFRQSMYRNVEENSILPEIKYIPQNYLIELAEPVKNKTGSDLNKIVRDLINEDLESKNNYDNFLSIVKLNDKKREGIIDSYFEIKNKISELEAEIKQKSSTEILNGNIQSNIEKIKELNKNAGLTEAQITEYADLQKQLDDLSIERTKSNNDFSKIKSFNSEAINTLTALRNKKNFLINSLESEEMKEHFVLEYSDLESLLTNIQAFSSLFELDNGIFKLESKISKIFIDNTEIKIGLLQKLQPYTQTEEAKKQIGIINESISNDKASLQAIEQLQKEIQENKKSLLEQKEKIFSLYEENHTAYVDVISQLSSRIVELENDGLKIDGMIKFNFPKLQRQMLSFSDGRSASYNQFRIFDETLHSLSEYDLSNHIVEVKKVFNAIVETEEYVLTKKANKKDTIKVLLDDYFFDYWEIEYKNDKLGKMSTGKASFVILMLIIGLSKSKAPILIDQPEDNLDNRSITADLVEYLKRKKLERQIILVTHNANIVVNADAENIIIANQKGQGDKDSDSQYQFDYVNGPLENTFISASETNMLMSMGIREHIADIVEGGEAAFKKRENKYGFSKRVPH